MPAFLSGGHSVLNCPRPQRSRWAAEVPVEHLRPTEPREGRRVLLGLDTLRRQPEVMLVSQAARAAQPSTVWQTALGLTPALADWGRPVPALPVSKSERCHQRRAALVVDTLVQRARRPLVALVDPLCFPPTQSRLVAPPDPSETTAVQDPKLADSAWAVVAADRPSRQPEGTEATVALVVEAEAVVALVLPLEDLAETAVTDSSTSS